MSVRTATLRAAVVAVTALAALGSAAATGPPATAGGSDLEHVYSPSLMDLDPTKSWFVTCPRGKVVLSGGAYLLGDATGVHIDTLRPASDGSLFEAAASRTAPSRRQTEWQLVVYGVCAPPPAGLEYLPPVPSDSYDSPLRTALATCPAGKELVGFGGRAAVEPDRDVALTVLLPSADLTRVVVQSWAAEGGETDDWTAEAYAVCADPLPNAELIRTTDGPDDSNDKIATSICPAGKQLHAMGAGIFNAAGQAWYAGLYPAEDLQSGTAIPVEDPTGLDWNWFVTSAGICA
jgi:hypothetical protein